MCPPRRLGNSRNWRCTPNLCPPKIWRAGGKTGGISCSSIRGLQRGYLDGRELVTDFKNPDTNEPYNPDFAALAKAHGVDGIKVSRSADFRDALKTASEANRPFLIDLEVDPGVKPPSTGSWQLPPMPAPEPVFGARWTP